MKKLSSEILIFLIVFSSLVAILVGAFFLLNLFQKKPTEEVHSTKPLQPLITKKNLVFDEGHQNANESGYSEFLSYFNQAGFKVKKINDEICDDNLEGAQALLITIHDSDYLQSELDAIDNFVQRGGSLIVLGDFVKFYDINRVTTPLGVALGQCSTEWDTFPTNDHFLIKNVDRLELAASACLKISNLNFLVIAESKGMPVIAAKNGINKILIVGDSNLCDSQYLNLAHNRVFCQNIVAWLDQ